MDRLAGLPDILRTIPFEACYRSCNLDHVIQNRLNLTDEEKEEGAYAFTDRCQADRNCYLAFFQDPSLAVAGSRQATWGFITEGSNSLKRHSNLALCFPA